MGETTTRLWLNLLPKQTLSRLMGWCADRRPPQALLQSVISAYVEHFGIDLSEAVVPEDGFRSFDEFFTRHMKPGTRPIDPNSRALISPADGVLGRSGLIENLDLEQIKGKKYSAADLLASPHKAEAFTGGAYSTVYLSPGNYHRVHFPCDGQVTGFHYVPGTVYPVNPAATHSIDHLFSRNERLIVYMKTDRGKVAVVMVGATCVARITQSYDPQRARFSAHKESKKEYFEVIPVNKGNELGVFHLGSTVVMLFSPEMVTLDPNGFDQPVKMGQRIGDLT